MSLTVEVILLLCLLPLALALTKNEKLPKFQQNSPKFQQNVQREVEEREIPTMTAVSRNEMSLITLA